MKFTKYINVKSTKLPQSEAMFQEVYCQYREKQWHNSTFFTLFRQSVKFYCRCEIQIAQAMFLLIFVMNMRGARRLCAKEFLETF